MVRPPIGMRQEEPAKPIASRLENMIGLLPMKWNLGTPNRTQSAPLGAGFAHFERFTHGGPPERR